MECRRWRRLEGGDWATGKFLSLPVLNSRAKKGRFIEPAPVEWEGGGPNFSGAYGPMSKLMRPAVYVEIQNSPIAASWNSERNGCSGSMKNWYGSGSE